MIHERHKTVPWMVHACALSLALVSGFMLGTLAARRNREQTLSSQDVANKQKLTRRQSRRGSKRKSGRGKSEDSGRGLGGASPSTYTGDDEQHQDIPKGLSSRRSKRGRNKRLCPKDLALDAFTKVARSHVTCIGAGDYQSLLLLPRAAFMGFGCFVPYASCRDRLVNLGQARIVTAGVNHLQILYVSCSWASTGGVTGAEDDFETVRAFLESNLDLGYVYIGRSCVASDTRRDARVTQLRHVPLALLRADTILVLPRPTTMNPEHGAGDQGQANPGARRLSDLSFYSRGAWSRMELAVAAVGQSKVLVAFRAAPFPETVWEVKAGMTNMKEVARKAADALEAAASSAAKAGVGVDEEDATATVAATAVKAACDNWFSSELDPLASLGKARTVVAAAESTGGADLLRPIQEMRPMPSTEVTEELRASLGEENVAGDRELAMSLLLFTVLCTQPKDRSSYTDAFLEDAGKMEVVYRPIAVVRSPYRERFGTPRQPQVTTAVLQGGALEGRIVFLKGHGYGKVVSGTHLMLAISLVAFSPSVVSGQGQLSVLYGSTKWSWIQDAAGNWAVSVDAVGCMTRTKHIPGLGIFTVGETVGACCMRGSLPQASTEDKPDFLRDQDITSFVLRTQVSGFASCPNHCRFK